MAMTKMQVSFSDERRKVSGSPAFCPAEQGQFGKSQVFRFIGRRVQGFSAPVSATQRFHIFSQTTGNHQDLLPCWPLVLAFKSSHRMKSLH